MTDPPTTADVEEDAFSEVLLEAPRETAERLERFLGAHGIGCRIRPKGGSDGWEVLVRPERSPNEPEEEPQPEPRPAAPADPADPAGSDDPAGPMEPAVLCELPWEQAWRLTQRLIAAGIPAAVMAGEGEDREKPMHARTVPVGVRPSDLERARSFVD
ncbi:MAG TPA: hypothetical protein VFA25_07955 [Actinomycetota bacterium]|nr:hypothetical protein [Actinomycetota bacterium]